MKAKVSPTCILEWMEHSKAIIHKWLMLPPLGHISWGLVTRSTFSHSLDLTEVSFISWVALPLLMFTFSTICMYLQLDANLTRALKTLILGLAIGSYLSDLVVFMKIRPQHTISAEIKFYPPNVSWIKSNCIEFLNQTSTVNISLVFSYIIKSNEINKYGMH